MENRKGKVAVIGSGLIGRNWAMLFTSAGYSVCLYDVLPQALDNALTDIKEKLVTYEASKMLRGTLSAEEQTVLISTSHDLKQCVQNALYVQECVPEVLTMKQEVFKQLDDLVAADTILASSSSGIPCSKYTETLSHREHCIVAHPVNPPYFMPLVELVPAPWTSQSTVERSHQLMTDIGQSPITLRREIAGFVQPRLQYAIIMEAVRLIKVCSMLCGVVVSAEGVDQIMTSGLGMRYAFLGTLETAHLNAEGFESYADRYKDMIYKIASDSGPPVSMDPSSDHIQQIDRELSEKIPLDKLKERCAWRDEMVASLAQLKKELD